MEYLGLIRFLRQKKGGKNMGEYNPVLYSFLVVMWGVICLIAAKAAVFSKEHHKPITKIIHSDEEHVLEH